MILGEREERVEINDGCSFWLWEEREVMGGCFGECGGLGKK